MVDSKVHKLDSFPHGVVILLLGREQTERFLSCLKDSEKERVWWAFTIFMLPRKNGPGRIGLAILIGWKYATTITVKLIYVPNKNTKFFLLHNLSLQLFLNPLWLWVGIPLRVPSMSHICLKIILIILECVKQ